MYKNKRILALIIAKAQSEGLPGKNIKPLLGKPLVAWTIEQAKKSKYIDRIVISTEEKKIAALARKYGAEAPFMRPKRLVGKKVAGIDVALHAISWMEKNKELYNLLMLLQPTSPLRTNKDIDMAIELLFKRNVQSVVSVCETEHHPFWSYRIQSNGCLMNYRTRKSINSIRQDLPTFYRINGAIYLGYWDFLKKTKSLISKDSYAYIMPQERSVDIDSALDFMLAERLLDKDKSNNHCR